MPEFKRDSRYDILFEPVRIGPVIAKNRFYQTPQCAGMGDTWINGQAKHREVKAEGGWAVVNTEICESHHTSNQSYPCMRLWDDGDIKAMAKVVEGIHKHGALAGTEIGHLGMSSANLYTREAPISPSGGPVAQIYPTQVRAMDKEDIREFLRAQTNAARRAREAGVDIIYADASGLEGPPLSFLSTRLNQRLDEYGGSMENRVRLFRQFIEATREGAGPDRAVAVRVCVDELLGAEGLTVEEEGQALIELVGEMPDLWDINVSDWENDSIVSRFGKEGSQEYYAAFIKKLTTKPVVSVGRFTSPDTMVSMIKRGVQDFIGAARPSIADPFLPRKIEEGRIDDIRECIGCNVCVTGFTLSIPSRCTQNPTMGEEWRRGWHPERIALKTSDESVLIVGGGPAGLECAHALGKRGYQVTLAEAQTELGGRVTRESRLPGLAEWARVRDYRTQQFLQLPNVETYLDSQIEVDHILEFGCENIVIATGSKWRRDGIGHAHHLPVNGWDQSHVVSADYILDGQEVNSGPVVIFDDDHYYLGNIIAEKLRQDGHEVFLVSPIAEVSHFTHYTQEHRNTIKRMYELGIQIITDHAIANIGADSLELIHAHSGEIKEIPCATLVMVTLRDCVDDLYHQLLKAQVRCTQSGIKSIKRIGDCFVPSTIAAAVWWGHRYARELNEPETDGVPFRRERTMIYED